MSKRKTEIYLEGLPRKYGVGANKNKLTINWKECKGIKIKCIYNGKKIEVEIIDYGRNKKDYLTIKYKNEEFDIKSGSFIKCHFGKILGERTSEFKLEIGQVFKNDKRDLIIIDRKYIKTKSSDQNFKYYKYKCNKCGFECGEHWSIRDKEHKEELWVEESCLNRGQGCSCCGSSPKIVVEGINDIPTTAPWMVKYFVNPEDAKKYTNSSAQKIATICLDCGQEKIMSLSNLFKQGFFCKKCSDGLSFPNKFMTALLTRLSLNFIPEYSPDWIESKRYDFYIPSMNLIIEMDGGFHNKDNTISGQTKEESKVIDNYKDKTAQEHGLEVIRIDCDYGDMSNRFNYIKNNVIKSKLNESFDLSKIDWNKIGESACKNLIKEVCEIKRVNPDLNTIKIGEIVGLERSTVCKYLKQGNKLWDWCSYDGKEEMKKYRKTVSKAVVVFKNGIKLGVYNSTLELERQSEKTLGVKLFRTEISAVCKNRHNQYKGFTFKYIEENTNTNLHNQELVQAS